MWPGQLALRRKTQSRNYTYTSHCDKVKQCSLQNNGPNNLDYQTSSKNSTGLPIELLLDVQQSYFSASGGYLILLVDIQQVAMFLLLDVQQKISTRRLVNVQQSRRFVPLSFQVWFNVQSTMFKGTVMTAQLQRNSTRSCTKVIQDNWHQAAQWCE